MFFRLAAQVIGYTTLESFPSSSRHPLKLSSYADLSKSDAIKILNSQQGIFAGLT